MSNGFAQRTVKFINKVGTYTSYLQCSYGDLWQTYTRNGNTFENITPNFVTMRPVISFVCISSRVAGQANVNGHPTWYIGGVQINHGSTVDGVINGQAASGYFELVAQNVQGGVDWYGLRIKKNIVDLTNGSSVGIDAVGTMIISATGTPDEVRAHASISITPATSNGIHIGILDITTVDGIANKGRNFTFTEEGQTITMKVETYEGVAILDDTPGKITANAITYQWQKITQGSWTNIANATDQTLQISEDDVMTYQQYRCAVSRNNSLLGYGTANVMDATDPFVIVPNPNPRDETIEDDGDTVSYNPQIVSRNSGSPQADLTAMGFYFTYLNSEHVDITPAPLIDTSVTPNKKKKVTGTGPDSQGNNAHFVNNDGTQGGVCNSPVDFSLCNNNGDIIVSIETVADLKDYN